MEAKNGLFFAGLDGLYLVDYLVTEWEQRTKDGVGRPQTHTRHVKQDVMQYVIMNKFYKLWNVSLFFHLFTVCLKRIFVNVK